MPKFLVFQVYGPMQAWGDIAVGEIRPVAGHPGRSGIAGLLAAALGWTRDGSDAAAYLRLAAALRIAVRADAPGTPLHDYHTTQTPGKTKEICFATRRDELAHEHQNLIQTFRHYLQDAVFTVCATTGERIDWSLDAFAEALCRPSFVTYLGRKACPPSLPFAPRTGDFGTIEEALSGYPVSEAVLKRLAGRDRDSPTVWWDVDLPTRLNVLGELARRDVPESRAGQFRFLRRIERYGKMPARREVADVP